ncbi:hypothetical protein D3C76_1737110 [compost metagenome]
MPNHVQIACHLGHKIAGTVMIVIVHILLLNLVVQKYADPIEHILRGPFVLHRRQVGKARTQQGKANHAQAEHNEQPPLFR